MATGHENLQPVRTTEEAKERGRKGGLAKKGSKHLSTHIQEMLNDENFETMLIDPKDGVKQYKGVPIKAIIAVAIHKALHDKDKGQQWAEWLAKHGYGSTLKIEVEDPRQNILNKYLNEGDEDGGQTDGSVEGSSEDSA